MISVRPDARVGTDFGAFHIEAVIGRGGMGVVYLAQERALGRKVALKLLPDELAQDTAFRARFERESHLAAAIDHPNIIPVYEAGEVGGTVFLAMRYVAGTDFASRLRDDPPPPEGALLVLAQVAKALDAAHAHGLVHRDVKPANILLAPAVDGTEPGHAYLTDFGLTKQVGSDSGLTMAGAFLGTLAYMAPEQIDGREVDGQADQYSLAATAFEALTGQPPFVREQEIAVAMAHLKDPPPSASTLRPELPSGVDTVLARGLAKDPKARYPSCGAFMAELQGALDAGSGAAGAWIAGPAVARPSRRGRVTPSVGLVALVLVAIGAAGLLASQASSFQPARSPDAPAGPTTMLQQIRQSGTISVAVLPRVFPEDPRRGFDIDVASEIAQRLGVTATFVEPGEELIVGGDWQGRFDVSVASTTITQPRREVLDFSEPYAYSPAQMAVFMLPTGTPTIADLQGGSLCVGQGTVYQAWAEGTLRLGDDSAIAPAPSFGNLDVEPSTYMCMAMAVDTPSGSQVPPFTAWLSSQDDIADAIGMGAPIVPFGDPVFYEAVAIATSKRSAPHADLLAEIDRILDAMRADGSLSAFSRYWFGGVDVTTK